MKKGQVLLVAFTILGALLYAAEKTDWEKKELKGKVKKLSTEATDYYFSDKGNLSSESYDYDEYYCGDIYYYYDDKGRLTSWEDEDLYEGLIYGEYFSYDEQGRLKTKSYQEYADQATITYSYDKNGYLTGEKTTDQDGAQIRRTEYVNDKNGNKLKELLFNASDELEKYFENKYDKNSNKTEAALFNPDKTLKSRTEYVYNAKNKVIKETGWGPSSKIYSAVFIYDDKNNEIKREFTDLIENTTTITVTGYVYDEKGNWTEKTSSVLDGDAETTKRGISYYED